jgi:hypothetical protein
MARSKDSDSIVATDPKVLEKVPEARAMGVAWANELQKALRAENRRAAGGWPGTMREASFRVRPLTGTWNVVGCSSLNQEQSEQLTRTLYFSAKDTWRSQSEREERDVDAESQARY